MIIVDPKGLGTMKCLRVMNAIGGVLRKHKCEYKQLREHDIETKTIYYSWVMPNEFGTYSGEVPAFVAQLVPKNGFRGSATFYVGFGVILKKEGKDTLSLDKIISNENLLGSIQNPESPILKNVLEEAGI